jgi:hypothetical protein
MLESCGKVRVSEHTQSKEEVAGKHTICPADFWVGLELGKVGTQRGRILVGLGSSSGLESSSACEKGVRKLLNLC